MMKKVLVAVLVLLVTVGSAATAQSWILPIHHRDGGGWIECPGAGYNGSSAWKASGADGIRRVYWSLEGSGVPTGTNLYIIEFWVPAGYPNDGGWQPIESQFNGGAGENWPMEPGIPWAGAYGTNHQWIGSEYGPNDSGWKSTGPGPHTPDSPAYNAGAGGTYMWLKETSWLYAKWDFPWDINRCWAELRITLVPEPSSFVALLAGVPALVLFRRRK
ncbi:MAG: PEP-CTERM sorting domain-containing protein [Armatimonadota bacterium]